MADKAPAFAFTTNVPVNVDIRFVDVRPGKLWNDPNKGQVKLPAQVSIKGTLGGTETIAFLKGKVWVNVKALATAGVIAPEWASKTDELEAVDKVTSLPVLHGKVTATLQKLAGDRWENMVFTPLGQSPALPPDRVTSPYREPAKAQPFDEPTDDERFAEFSKAVDSLRPEAPTIPVGDAEARYFALFERVAAHQARIGKLHGFPVDGSSVQAMSFSIFKA